MIAFKYTKTDGAEYISHLDLLRHIDRTLRRAGIAVEYSQGYHRHARIFMGAPLALGVRSLAEYCAIDTDFDGDFMQAFNARSPAGIKCVDCKVTQNNPNYAQSITACRYVAEGGYNFDVNEVLAKKSIIITDRRRREVDIRGRILTLENRDGRLEFTLTCGEKNLRPDLFCEWIEQNYGTPARDIVKVESVGANF